jgi:4-amino-4-deoxychorismate lyase
VAESLLRDEADTLMAGQARAVLKIQITRGCGGRGYGVADTAASTRILSRHAWPDNPAHYWRDGIRIHLCQTILCEDRQLSGIKHLNRLPQILASREWQQYDCQEGFMFYPDDTLAEGTRTNIFLVKHGELLTPDLARGGVEGVMRGCILELADKIGLASRHFNPARQQLAGMDEVFVCNSLLGIWPVNQVAAWRFTPGPVTRQLQEQLALTLAVEAGP